MYTRKKIKKSITRFNALSFYNTRLSQMVRMAMAVAIFLSYSLQFYVPVNIVEPFVQRQFETPRGKDLAATSLRIVLVTFTCKKIWFQVSKY